MKKKLALVLAAAMVMGTVLTGCSSGGGSTQAAAPEATEAPKEAETEGGAAESEAAGTVKGRMEGGTSLNFTTGGDQGTYYGFGGVLSGKIGESNRHDL